MASTIKQEEQPPQGMPAFTTFKQQQNRVLCAVWGVSGALAFSLRFLSLLHSSPPLPEHATAAPGSSAWGNNAGRCLDLAFSAAFALCACGIAGSSALLCTTFSDSNTALRRCCVLLASLCSVWYLCGLFVTVANAPFEVLTMLTWLTCGMMHLPIPFALLAVHLATMACYFVGAGWGVCASLLQASLLHGIGALLYAGCEHKDRVQYTALVEQLNVHNRQQQSTNSSPPLSPASPHSSSNKLELPQAASNKAVKAASNCAATEGAADDLGYRHSSPVLSPRPTTTTLNNNSSAHLPVQQRHSLESNMSPSGGSDIGSVLSNTPSPFISIQGWGLHSISHGQPPWRSTSSMSDGGVGEPVTDTNALASEQSLHNNQQPAEPRYRPSRACQSAAKQARCSDGVLCLNWIGGGAQSHHSSSNSNSNARNAPHTLAGQLRQQVLSNQAISGFSGFSSSLSSKNNSLGTPGTSAAAPVTSTTAPTSKHAVNPACATAERGMCMSAPLARRTSSLRPEQPTSVHTEQLTSLRTERTEERRASNLRLEPHSSTLLSSEQSGQQLKQSQQQLQHFRRCIESAWEVGGYHNNGMPLLSNSPASIPPALSALSPMVTTPTDGCIMLCTKGIGLCSPNVELRARMHGLYFPVRVAPARPSQLGQRNSIEEKVRNVLPRAQSFSEGLPGRATVGGSEEELLSGAQCIDAGAVFAEGKVSTVTSTAAGTAAATVAQQKHNSAIAPTKQIPIQQQVTATAGRDENSPPPPPARRILSHGQWELRDLNSVVVTITGLQEAGSSMSGLLTLECQVDGTLSSSQPVLVLSGSASDDRLQSELLAAFATDGSEDSFTMEALALEQEHPRRMRFDNCSGVFGIGSSDHSGLVGSIGEVDGEEEENESEDERETSEKGEEGSWMSDFVSDLGFWLECIDMLDVQQCTAAANVTNVAGTATAAAAVTPMSVAATAATTAAATTTTTTTAADSRSASMSSTPPLLDLLPTPFATNACSVNRSLSMNNAPYELPTPFGTDNRSRSFSCKPAHLQLPTPFAVGAPLHQMLMESSAVCGDVSSREEAWPVPEEWEDNRSDSSSDGPDYMEQLPMLRGHSVPRAVLVMVGTQLLASALEQSMRTLACRLIKGLVQTLGIKREQVCNSVRTVSGGWGVLHCAVRSQDLPTLQIALSLCGSDPTHAWLMGASPAAPGCTPLHMAAVLPDGGEFATAILARYPEVQWLWLGLPADLQQQQAQCSQQQVHAQIPQQNGHAQLQHQLNAQSHLPQRQVCDMSSQLRVPQQHTQQQTQAQAHSLQAQRQQQQQRVQDFQAQQAARRAAVNSAAANYAAANGTAVIRDAQMGVTMMTAAPTTAQNLSAARVPQDPRISSPAALAAACGNWVRTAWAHTMNSHTAMTSHSAMTSPRTAHTHSAGNAATNNISPRTAAVTAGAAALDTLHTQARASHFPPYFAQIHTHPAALPPASAMPATLMGQALPAADQPNSTASTANAATKNNSSNNTTNSSSKRGTGDLSALTSACTPAAVTQTNTAALINGTVAATHASSEIEEDTHAPSSHTPASGWLQTVTAWVVLLCCGFSCEDDAVAQQGSVKALRGTAEGEKAAGGKGGTNGEDALLFSAWLSSWAGTAESEKTAEGEKAAHGENGSSDTRMLESLYAARPRCALLELLGLEEVGTDAGLPMHHIERAWLSVLSLRGLIKCVAALALLTLQAFPTPSWLLVTFWTAVDALSLVLFPFVAEQVRVRCLTPFIILDVLLAVLLSSSWAADQEENALAGAAYTALHSLVMLLLSAAFECSHRTAFLLTLVEKQQQQQD